MKRGGTQPCIPNRNHTPFGALRRFGRQKHARASGVSSATNRTRQQRDQHVNVAHLGHAERQHFKLAHRRAWAVFTNKVTDLFGENGPHAVNRFVLVPAGLEGPTGEA